MSRPLANYSKMSWPSKYEKKKQNKTKRTELQFFFKCPRINISHLHAGFQHAKSTIRCWDFDPGTVLKKWMRPFFCILKAKTFFKKSSKIRAFYGIYRMWRSSLHISKDLTTNMIWFQRLRKFNCCSKSKNKNEFHLGQYSNGGGALIKHLVFAQTTTRSAIF